MIRPAMAACLCLGGSWLARGLSHSEASELDAPNPVQKCEKTYYKSGRLKTVERYRMTSFRYPYGPHYGRHGKWVSFSPDGKQSTTISYPKPHGRWIEWHENGNKALEENYRHGRPHGTSTYWYGNGTKQAERHYQDGRQHGTDIYWYPDGVKTHESHYKDGIPYGPHVRWYPNGHLWVRKELRGATNPHGKWTSCTPDGQVSTELVFPGATGKWIEWWYNGKKAVEGEYLDGKEHGKWFRWDATGKCRDATLYEKGFPVGMLDKPGEE